jgi:hypothetical protein
MKKSLVKIAKWFFGIVLGIFLLISGVLYFFKDEICGIVVTEVNKHLKAKVTVSDVDLTFWSTFPNVSVDFNHVFIPDTYANATKFDTLLYSDRIRLKFNPVDLWNEDYHVEAIEVQPGTVQLKVNQKGEINYDIFKSSEDTTSTKFELKLEQVTFEDVRFAYNNEATQQHYETGLHQMELEGNFTEKIFTLHAKSNLKVKKAKSGQVTLISNKEAAFDLDIEVNQETSVFEIPNAIVYLANLPFQLKGKVTPKDLNFEIHSKDIQLADVANNFSVAQVDDIKKFEGTGKVFLDLFINGLVESTTPVTVNCDFGVLNGSLTEPVKHLKVKNIDLLGKYSNEGGEEEEFLKLSKIKFTTPGGPFSGNLLLTKFREPNYKGNANGVINLDFLHSLFHLPHVEDITGNVALQTDFNVQTKIQPSLIPDYEVVKCEGSIDMRNVALKLLDDKRYFRHVNGSMYLRNDEAGVDNVTLNVGATDLAFNGVFRNIINYLKHDGQLDADIEVKSNYIDVEDLGTTSKEEKIQDGRDFVLPNNIDGKVFMDVGRIKYEKHEFKQVSGTMNVGNRRIDFPDISLRNSDANIHGNLIIEERYAEIFHITTQVETESVQFKSLFREWDNFHQDVINENNIFGKVQARVYFEAPFDLRSGIVSESIKSQVYLRIDDGRLKNVDAFKSITESLKTSSAKLVIGKDNIVGLEKKLLDLKFETLENTFVIQNGRLEIPAMVIHTSALDVEMSGTHTFSNLIDYRFAFRFRDLKDKNRITEFGEELDDGTGMRVYMRMTGSIDNPIIVWDKTSKKEQAKENREAEKQTVKSMLKSEFGLFSKDSTVNDYQKKAGPKEELKIEFGPIKEEDPIDTKKPKKDSKIKNTLKGWKEQSEKEKAEEIGFD